MKIIFVNRYFSPDESASSLMLTDLAFHLSSQNSDVHVITSRQTYDNTAIKLPATAAINNVAIHRVWTTRFGRATLIGRLFDYLSFYITAIIRIYLITGKNDIVVVNTDPPMLSIPAWLITKLRKAKQINWLHDLFPEIAIALGIRWLKGGIGNILIRLRNLSLVHSCMNVVIGERMKLTLSNENIPEDRTYVIHNWSDDFPVTQVSRKENPLIKEWGLDDKFVMGYSGNLGRAHEFMIILDAAARLSDNRDIIFLFIGGGTHFNNAIQEQRTRGLKNVMFRPYQPREMLKYSLSLPHVHLVSLCPGMAGLMVPSKIYGIVAAKRPVIYIGDAESEIAQIIEEADCGMNIRNGAVDDLVKAVLGMQANPERLEEMGRNARRIFEERYSSHRAFRQWEELLAKIERTEMVRDRGNSCS